MRLSDFLRYRLFEVTGTAAVLPFASVALVLSTGSFRMGAGTENKRDACKRQHGYCAR